MFEISDIKTLLSANAYPGRGIVAGTSACGEYAVCAYFIMGRSANSRNRIFKLVDNQLFTEPFDPSEVEDPSLIIYRAMAEADGNLIVTNGDQTDTVYKALKNGKTFIEALDTRTFEPDKPNYTPRISAMISFYDADFSYQMSVIKSIDGKGSAPMRSYYKFASVKGLGHFIHTYIEDGDPLPPFCVEPERIAVPSDIDEFAEGIWNSLNPDNKISLYVKYTNKKTREVKERLFNKNEG